MFENIWGCRKFNLVEYASRNKDHTHTHRSGSPFTYTLILQNFTLQQFIRINTVKTQLYFGHLRIFLGLIQFTRMWVLILYQMSHLKKYDNYDQVVHVPWKRADRTCSECNFLRLFMHEFLMWIFWGFFPRNICQAKVLRVFFCFFCVCVHMY